MYHHTVIGFKQKTGEVFIIIRALKLILVEAGKSAQLGHVWGDLFYLELGINALFPARHIEKLTLRFKPFFRQTSDDKSKYAVHRDDRNRTEDGKEHRRQKVRAEQYVRQNNYYVG